MHHYQQCKSQRSGETDVQEYVRNSRGMRLFSCSWVPKAGSSPPKALVFLCHGYAVECAVTMRGTGERLASAGFAVFGLDYEGHGRSDGLQGYVPDFHALVGDCDAFFVAKAVSTHSSSGRRFLLGESMGGAVALLPPRSRPDFWTGAVLVAPMCKVLSSSPSVRAAFFLFFVEKNKTVRPSRRRRFR
jgi:alpha-beta hydrolase superfamily lysophospholipase